MSLLLAANPQNRAKSHLQSQITPSPWMRLPFVLLFHQAVYGAPYHYFNLLYNSLTHNKPHQR